MDEEIFFYLGVKRNPGTLMRQPRGKTLNLGSGFAPIDGAINLDRPEWRAPELRYPDGSVAAVHMHHFLEHLDVDAVRLQLIEVERVLMEEGCAYITVPHAMAPLAYQAPDHRSYWTEEGWQDMFYSQGYDSSYGHEWKFDITWMKVVGVKWANLCVQLQLVKRIEGAIWETPWRRDV